jgi:hypothetical protein
MDIEFIATVSVIAADPAERRQALLHMAPLAGGGACFGSPAWPVERPVPQMSAEFEVADADAVSAAAAEQGFELLHGARQEPWGRRWRACRPSIR